MANMTKAHIISTQTIRPIEVQVARSIEPSVDKAITAEIDMVQEVMYFMVWKDSEKVHSSYSLRDAIDAYNLI